MNFLVLLAFLHTFLTFSTMGKKRRALELLYCKKEDKKVADFLFFLFAFRPPNISFLR